MDCKLWEIVVILLVNLLLYILVTMRWWIIVRAEAKSVPYLPLLGVRVSVFGVSYFTLGPQVGGEPLQVFALERKYGISFTRAVASVLLDKLLEFLADFLVLGIGVTAVLHAGILSGNSAQWIISGVVVTSARPFAGHSSISFVPPAPSYYGLIQRLPFLHQASKPVRFLKAAEWMAGRFCQRHPRALLAALGVSLLAGAGMIIDYSLMVRFLGISLPFWKTIAGWTAGWLSF